MIKNSSPGINIKYSVPRLNSGGKGWKKDGSYSKILIYSWLCNVGRQYLTLCVSSRANYICYKTRCLPKSVLNT